MKKKTIIASMFAFTLLAPVMAQPHHGPFPGCPHSCCCCCNQDKPDQRPPQKGEMPSFITDKLIKKLALSDDQVTKLKEEEKAFMEKIQQMRPSRGGKEQFSPDEMREKMDTMMSEHDAAVKEILSGDQYKKYQKYMKENRPKGPGNGGPDGDWME